VNHFKVKNDTPRKEEEHHGNNFNIQIEIQVLRNLKEHHENLNSIHQYWHVNVGSNAVLWKHKLNAKSMIGS